ncbi:hypothetical protein D3C84_94400 [compost metagenome]
MKRFIDIGDGFNLRTIVALLDPQPTTFVCLSQRFCLRFFSPDGVTFFITKSLFGL